MTPEQLNEDVLAAMKLRASSLRPVMDLIGLKMVSSTQQNFEAGGRPTPWAPLAYSTQKQKNRLGYTRILVRTAHLLQSIDYKASDAGVNVGTNLPYARIQQEGGPINHPSRAGSVSFKYNKKTGELKSGFASKKAKETSRTGIIELAFSAKRKFGVFSYIQARPYLVFQPGEVQAYSDLVNRYIVSGQLK